MWSTGARRAEPAADGALALKVMGAASVAIDAIRLGTSLKILHRLTGVCTSTGILSRPMRPSRFAGGVDARFAEWLLALGVWDVAAGAAG